MGNVNYELPDHLGKVTLTVPLHWVGARAEGVEALWIDQQANGFKENVTLKISTAAKTEEPEKLMDRYIEKLLSKTGISPLHDIRKTPGRRMFSFDNQIENHELRQDQLILYAATATHSYLVIISSTYLRNTDNVDLSTAEITSE